MLREHQNGRGDENMMDKELLRSPGIFSGLLQVFAVKSVIIQVVAKKPHGGSWLIEEKAIKQH